MSSSFPVPRVQLPKVALSAREQRAMKRMITRMLQHTVAELDRHTHVNGGVVDASRWKAVGSKDDLHVFREREAGATSAALAFALDKVDALPPGSTVAPLTPPGMQMTGYTRGKVENAMDAVVTKSQEDLALVLSFMHHEDIVDCAVLHTIAAPAETDPFHFLGIKYFVRKAPVAGTRLIKHRDSVYLEFTGYTETTRGERLGFHLLHSVELAEFPPLTARNSVRTLHSVRYLYRQQSEDVVEVFMQGNVDVSGMAVKPLASAYTNDALFGLATLVACAEAKRLTQMWRAQQARNNKQGHRKRQSKRASMALECSMCRQKRKLFGGASLAACELCAEAVCTRCRTEKKVFEMETGGILGRFKKLSVCKCCVLAANKALSQPEEPQLVIIMSEQLQLDREGSRDRRRRGTSSSGSSQTRSRSSLSCPSASSEEYSPAQPSYRQARDESVATTVSSGGYPECPVVPVSAVDMRARAYRHQPVYAFDDEQMEIQLRQHGAQANAVKAAQQQQQLALREHHRVSLQPSNTAPNQHQVLTRRPRQDRAQRRAASTGSTYTAPSEDHNTSSHRSAPSSQQSDLFARMVELNRVAESTYNTTQQHGALLSQQMRRRGT
jgi:hypothetical protein